MFPSTNNPEASRDIGALVASVREHVARYVARIYGVPKAFWWCWTIFR